MFNLLPGQGLGFTGSKLIAFGLGAVTEETITLPRRGGSGKKIKIVDNAYSNRRNEKELVEFLTIIYQVIK